MPIFMSIYDDGTPAFALNKISDSYIQISDDIHNQFIQNNAQGKQYKVKNLLGTTFNDIFEEYVQESMPVPPSIEDRLAAAESAILSLMGV